MRTAFIQILYLLMLARPIVTEEEQKGKRKKRTTDCGIPCRLKKWKLETEDASKKNPEAVDDQAMRHCRRLSSNTGRKKRFWHPWRRKRNRDRNSKNAYRMAVLATLSYWPFQDLSKPSKTAFKLRWQRRKTRRLRHYFSSAFKVFNRKLRLNDRGKNTLSHKKSPKNKDKTERNNPRYILMYWLYDWFEPTKLGLVNFHDTDVLVAKSDGRNPTLALSFAGTQSAADHVTNVQTFEPASHSGLFRVDGTKYRNETLLIEGSIHRGFLNAYSRVEKGWVLRLSAKQNDTDDFKIKDPLYTLHQRYRHCGTNQKEKKRNLHNRSNRTIDYPPESIRDRNATQEIVTKARNGGCHSKGEKLMTILRELIIGALQQGTTVHISGHSLGGGLATLLTLDIIINFPKVPIRNLHLWTFGAPQVADDVFLRSAIAIVPRLGKFLRKKDNFHRFVTFSDNCHVDLVSVVTEKALSPKPALQNRKTLRGSASRRLGGVRGTVTHFAEPHYLLTPHQVGEKNNKTATESSTTQSALHAHNMVNYLRGISRESQDYPLSTDLWPEIKVWLGEEMNDSPD